MYVECEFYELRFKNEETTLKDYQWAGVKIKSDIHGVPTANKKRCIWLGNYHTYIDIFKFEII